MFRKLTFIIALLIAQPCLAAPSTWGLPINLNDAQEAVHEKLGPPNEILNADEVKKLDPDAAKSVGRTNNEYFYSSGLVTRLHSGKVFGITINSHGDSPGWITYQRSIVNGVTLSDTYTSVVSKLGPPSKTELDEVSEMKGDLSKPVIFPAEKRCYWRLDGYMVQINFLVQAQSISEKSSAAAGSISTVFIYK